MPDAHTIDTLVLNRESRTFSKAPAISDLKELRGEKPNVIWVGVSDPTSKEFDELAREFNLHPLAVEDCRHRHQRPKLDEYQGYYFIVLYEAELLPECRLELRELSIFLGPNYVITVHSEPIRAIATASRLWREWSDLADRGAGLLAYLL